MINRYTLPLFVLFFLFILTPEMMHATVHTVTFTCCQYTPSNFSASVGDTVVWQGNFTLHPLESTTIPPGANPFSNSVGTVFLYVIAVAGNYNYHCVIHQPSMAGSFSATPVSLQDHLTLKPGRFELYQNYPNPFNPTTVISFELAVSSYTTLKVYNVLGNEVATLVNGKMPAGRYTVEFDGEALQSGVYFYRLQAGNFSETKKLLLLK